MSILGVFATIRHRAQLSVKLAMGACILGVTPAMAQAASPLQTPTPETVLVAQAYSLSAGDRGPAVTELQRQLGRSGLFPASAVNGVYGPQTTQAVRQFQRIRKLNVTGVADAQTLELLGVNLNRLPVGLSHPIHGDISGDRISAGSSREDIIVLQRVLRSYGFGVTVDGVYGPQTVQAVRTYERTADLPVDGIADRATLLDMNFSDSGRSSRGDRDRPDGRRYVAAIVAGPSELNNVRQDFPNATVETTREGEYISLGRFTDRSDAAAWVDLADELGYNARVLWD